MVSRGARDLQLHLQPERRGGSHIRVGLLSRSQHHGQSSVLKSSQKWVLWRVSWQTNVKPHLHIFGRQDKSRYFLNISYLWFHFPPVTSLVYVLSAFDKVYYSSQSYDVSPESSSRLELGAASMSASGLYTCLVTGGDIPFLEDSDSKTVMVASKFFDLTDSLIKDWYIMIHQYFLRWNIFPVSVPPSSRPTISGALTGYSPGDFVNLNCSTFNVRPSLHPSVIWI